MVQLDSRYIDEKDVSASGLPVGVVLMYDATDWADNVTMDGFYAMVGGTVPDDGRPGAGCCIPDVRTKFVMADAISCAGTTGGDNNLCLETCHIPTHTHTVCDHAHCMKQHNHSSTACSPCTGTESATHYHAMCSTNAQGTWAVSGAVATTTVGASSTGSGTESANHRHTVCSHAHAVGTSDIGNSCNTGGSTCETGSGTAKDNRPCYYSMIFVKRMG